MATLGQIRQVAIELKGNIETLKPNVDTVKTNVDAIHTAVTAWTLDGLDAALPTGAEVAAQLAAYNALSVTVSKPGNSLDDALAAVQAAA